MTVKEVCEVTTVHEEVVNRVQKALPDMGRRSQYLRHWQMKQD